MKEEIFKNKNFSNFRPEIFKKAARESLNSTFSDIFKKEPSTKGPYFCDFRRFFLTCLFEVLPDCRKN